jgi:hypothetical protein
MTITLLAPDGVAVTAQQERQARAAGHGGGSGRQLGGRSGFRVGTPSTVLTASSTTWTLGPCAAMIDPGASTHQGMYGWASDSNITGAVTAADATNPRKDIIYILVNDSTAGDGSGAVNANPVYVAGTASATPVAPSVPARGFLVGTISVPVAGGGSPTVALNPARYAAAGAPLPVSTLAERDALSLYDGELVQRLDFPGRPLQTFDGTEWSTIPTVQAVALPQGVDPGWTVSGVVMKTRVGSVTQVVLSGRMTRTVSADASSAIKTVANVVPSGYRPLGTGVDWPTNHLTAGGLIIRHVNAFIAADGTLTITNDPGSSYVMNVGEYWTLQASWWL